MTMQNEKLVVGSKWFSSDTGKVTITSADEFSIVFFTDSIFKSNGVPRRGVRSRTDFLRTFIPFDSIPICGHGDRALVCSAYVCDDRARELKRFAEEGVEAYVDTPLTNLTEDHVRESSYPAPRYWVDSAPMEATHVYCFPAEQTMEQFREVTASIPNRAKIEIQNETIVIVWSGDGD